MPHGLGMRDGRGPRKLFSHTPPRVRAERAACKISTRIAKTTTPGNESAGSRAKDVALLAGAADVLGPERRFVLATMREMVHGTELSPDQKICVLKLMIAVLIVGMLCVCAIVCLIVYVMPK
uniref:Uncharacterized protein n=1 Tax=Haptolina ericina TaxID=156174 RepID=A0A7S3BKQ8_9EUKA|mmetsp:Transcript_61916/g.137962  ORF Transcript_61916/g.137962 Transcript_61916/m.137962 type:complete len:122 (+) Transcript_61916:106-471(+)